MKTKTSNKRKELMNILRIVFYVAVFIGMGTVFLDWAIYVSKHGLPPP